jgi:hypothetical protein
MTNYLPASKQELTSVENDPIEALTMAERMLRNIGQGHSYDSGDFWTRVCAIQMSLREAMKNGYDGVKR